MALEYINTYECPVKKKFGVQGVMQNTKNMHSCRTMVAMMREHGKSDEEIMKEEIIHVVYTRGRPEQKSMKFKELFAQASNYAEWRTHCENCPANADSQPFGCYGAVHYPISDAGEQWLMDNFRGSAEDMGTLLQHLIEINEIDGSGIAEARHRVSADPKNPGIVKRRAAILKTYTDEDGQSKTLSSDQLIDVLLALREWDNPTMVAVLKDFGAVDQDKAEARISGQAVLGFIEGLGMGQEEGEETSNDLGDFLIEIDDGEEDSTVLEFKRFLHAIYVAHGIGEELLTDG